MFYQIIQSLLKYKNKGKLVKEINEGDRVIYGADKNKKVEDFYQKLYK